MREDSTAQRRMVGQLAAGQWGHVTRQQLLGHGVPGTTIDTWVRDDLLLPVHRGVYALGYRRVEPVAVAMAAVLAAGRSARLSHDSSLALWDLRRWPRIPEVISAQSVRRPGIHAHRSRTLRPEDCTVQLGVPVTRPARAIADVGARLTTVQRTRLIADARLRHILTVAEQTRLVGHRQNATRSGLEDHFVRWIARHGLPEPLLNVTVRGHEVDALWPRERVIVELDDPATHSDPLTFASDRRHDREDGDEGYTTQRYTRDDLTAPEAERLHRLIRSRR